MLVVEVATALSRNDPHPRPDNFKPNKSVDEVTSKHHSNPRLQDEV